MAPSTADPPEQLLPIDIHYSKFLYWLVDRKRISNKWAIHLKTARTLTRTALANTPPEISTLLDIPQLTPHQNLPYFKLKSYFTALITQTPPPVPTDKDILGRYKSPVLRAWADAVSAFETSHLYLADAAQHLVHNTNNEALAIKNNTARLNRDITNYARKQTQSIRSAADAKQRFQLALKQYSLRDEHPFDFEAQLSHHLDQTVPHVLRQAVQSTAVDHFAAAVRYYQCFAHYVAHKQQHTVCDLIQRIMNADVDQLTRAVQTTSSASEIDWSAIFTVEPDNNQPPSNHQDSAQAAIDWGIEIGETGTAEAESPVSTDIVEHGTTTAQTESHAQSDDQQIDWSAAMGVVNTDQATQDKTDDADQPPQLTLTDARVRESYLNQLIELDAFLAQREKQLKQIANSEVGIVLQQAKSVPTAIKNVDVESVTQMSNAVKDAIQSINSADTRHVLALQSNPKLLQRTAKTVLEKKHAAQRTHAAIEVLRRQRDAAAVELADESAKMEHLSQETIRLKKDTESNLSSLYGGRQVNIVGDINVMFSSQIASSA
ncbi:CDK5 regulatory subunit-associated protein 3 [Gracilariopsis chorda]|uniref:CDK5 regulatory subunit-associated protein 3 n=1 Tax=Gracilariopsis chorda TaxID=448386 RepID=A0A2V3IFS6_9FLOR|nr:CDK5 regulatory subunit-associated protein 3 [Gracilariopsis chorda]|eukprot:PXF40902.1 CDK5 regulatory subunit-associated protein 3 [Gracilariopsis chorda]